MRTANMSVVMAVLNGERFLSNSLQSIASQETQPKEIVIVNDGSTDGTENIIAQWRKSLPIITVKNERNKGMAESLNLGVLKASAPIILRLDADDEWLPLHVRLMETAFAINPQAVLVSTRATYVKAGKEVAASPGLLLNDRTIRWRLMWDNPIVHSAAAFRRAEFLRCGGYEDNSFAADYDLWIRLLAYGSYSFMSQETMRYHLHESSMSRISKRDSIAKRADIANKAIQCFSHVNVGIATTAKIAWKLRRLMQL